MMKTFRRAACVMVAAVVQAAAGQALTLTPPAAPNGYSNSLAVMAAIALKQVATVPKPADDPLPDTVREVKDVAYATAPTGPLALDLYLPARAEAARPALIFVHGGAWSGGKRDMYRYYTMRFAKRGYVCATVSYRLSRVAAYPAAVQDVKAAVRWVRAHAKEYHVDPDRIGVVGGSAGGHLAMMAGYADLAEFEGEGGNPGISSRVQAVVNIYGPTDLTTDFARKSGSVKAFLGGKTYEEAPERYRQASPMTHLSPGDPPTLVLHGTIDDVVPISQADELVKKLEAVGVPYVYDRLEGWPHAMDAAQVVNDRCRWFMERFFDKFLPLPKGAAAAGGATP